jgi:hypothetical protein
MILCNSAVWETPRILSFYCGLQQGYYCSFSVESSSGILILRWDYSRDCDSAPWATAGIVIFHCGPQRQFPVGATAEILILRWGPQQFLILRCKRQQRFWSCVVGNSRDSDPAVWPAAEILILRCWPQQRFWSCGVGDSRKSNSAVPT